MAARSPLPWQIGMTEGTTSGTGATGNSAGVVVLGRGDCKAEIKGRAACEEGILHSSEVLTRPARSLLPEDDTRQPPCAYPGNLPCLRLPLLYSMRGSLQETGSMCPEDGGGREEGRA
jgi:hypothetical protein